MSAARRITRSRGGAVLLLIGLLGAPGCLSPEQAPSLGDAYSGGLTTVFYANHLAFSQPAANLSLSEVSDFRVGNSFFERNWVTAPSSTTARDGLGPLFNAVACASCHAKDGRGRPPEGSTDDISAETVGLLFRLSIPGVDEHGGPLPDPRYGGQFKTSSIPGIEPHGKVGVTYETIEGEYGDSERYSLLAPHYRFHELAYGELDSELMVSPRIAPPMIGMGLLEAIDDDAILALADPDDRDGDGVRGRPNWVYDRTRKATVLGRFGWKANQPSVRQQVAGAFLGDIGITSSLFSQQDCAPERLDCLEAPTGGEPEIDDEILAFVVFYAKTLGVPARRDLDDVEVRRGEKLFGTFGCASCHHREFETSTTYPIPALAGQTIRPYTDLLLHDMGPGLADHRPDFLADGQQWRTPPLWGIGLLEAVNGHTRLLHDGRARGIAEAILWHAGEGEASREAFRLASRDERDALLRFLRSL
ncbi:MAG: c-type cytochrome [Myxococcales bacterium]|nr:c-type cytochrome [Myxococcales bacterium]